MRQAVLLAQILSMDGDKKSDDCILHEDQTFQGNLPNSEGGAGVVWRNINCKKLFRNLERNEK